MSRHTKSNATRIIVYLDEDTRSEVEIYGQGTSLSEKARLLIEWGLETAKGNDQ